MRDAIERLPWRPALPADGRPPHQYGIRAKSPENAWDVLAARVHDDPASYDAYFRGYPWPMHYWELEGHRYWRASGCGPTHMLNRCTLASVEPPRRVDEGERLIAWHGPPWAPDGTPWPPGYMLGPGPAHMRGQAYRAEEGPALASAVPLAASPTGDMSHHARAPGAAGRPTPRPAPGDGLAPLRTPDSGNGPVSRFQWRAACGGRAREERVQERFDALVTDPTTAPLFATKET